MTDVSSANRPVIPGNSQHIGARSEQQDSFGFSDFDDEAYVGHAGFLSVVADGMGGLAMGKDASAIAVKTFLSMYAAKEPEEKIATVLDRSLHAANRAVNELAAKAGLEGEAGTTLVAVVVHEGQLYRVAAGDSRIYLFREARLRQITTDYNYGRVLDRLVAQGDMKQAEAQSHPSRAALTSYLGKKELDEYDKPSDPPTPLLPGDKVLLASDGLFGFLQEEEFVKFLALEPQRSAEVMVNATVEKQRPYQDNVTVAILGYGLPVAAPLPDTQTRVMQPPPTSAEKPRPKSGRRKWTVVVGAVLVLAAAGFLGGQYFGGLSGDSPSRPGVEGKTDTEKPVDKVREKEPAAVSGASGGYTDVGASRSR